jgi:hypothetical protein
VSEIEDALYWLRMSGDLSSFLRAIRSDRPLTAGDRNLIADYIEGKIKMPKGKPPLANRISNARTRLLPLRAAAFECDRLKKEWRENGGPAGVSPRDLPKKALEIAAKQYRVNVDALAARMRLPLSRRYE